MSENRTLSECQSVFLRLQEQVEFYVVLSQKPKENFTAKEYKKILTNLLNAKLALKHMEQAIYYQGKIK